MTNGRSLTPRRKLAGLGLLAQSAVIAGALVAAWALLAPLAVSLSGTFGLKTALLAAAICWAGAQFSLLISAFLGGVSVMNRLVLGMLARAMFPLVVGTGLHLRDPDLAAAGLIFYVLVFYMVTLAADTALLLAQVPQPLPPKKFHKGHG